jgi:hypothetical protein
LEKKYIAKINFISSNYMTKSKKKINLENIDSTMEGGASFFTNFTNVFNHANNYILYLNNSKFFAGIVMILLNVGSKFITIQFSKSTEEYMKFSLSKQILIFAMAWMGTRDIYTALGLTAVFTILSDHLFNEESSLCIVPQEYRVLNKLIDTNEDGIVSETELNAAILVLEKAKKEKQRLDQKNAFSKFNFEKFDYDNKN